MELRRELLLTIGALVVLNLLLAFGAIGLFVRMGPAIERIIEANVVSISAAEQALAELARAGSAPVPPAAAERVRRSLLSARRNVTEAEEFPALEAAQRQLEAALAGDAQARAALVDALSSLIRVNRQAMSAADDEARRLGSAGAWAGVLVGSVSLWLSLYVLARFQRRLVLPVLDLHEVLENAREGDRLRRCRGWIAPRELVQAAESVNRLLDERLQRFEPRGGLAPPAGASAGTTSVRGAGL